MLYVCATPIGNLGDVTPRLLEALRGADLVAAEDTRHTRKLLSHFDIHTPLTSLFQHNEAQKTAEVMRLLREGRDVALVTDAGMPGISDPGMRLVARAIAEEIELTVVPGPSAVLTALVAAGFEADRFCFVGFLPRQGAELQRELGRWRAAGGLVVAFEAPTRLPRSLEALARVAPELRAAVCRELTKVHEEVARGTLAELSERFPPAGRRGSEALRGEITLVLEVGEPREEARTEAEAEAAARALLGRGLSRRDAAAALHVCLGVPRREAESLTQRVAAEPTTRSAGPG